MLHYVTFEDGQFTKYNVIVCDNFGSSIFQFHRDSDFRNFSFFIYY